MTTATTTPAIDDRRARTNVYRLAIGQALAGGNATVIFATGAIVGSTLAPDKGWATVPISMFVLGMAVGTLPTGYVSRVYGRRAAFMIGTSCGALSGLIAALAVVFGSFGLFCLATTLGGLYASVVQSFRFAATDGASAAFRPKAISWVMAGGVMSGVFGPQLIQWTMDLWPPYLFAASYLAQVVVALIAMIVLVGVDMPKPAAADLKAGRPLGEIARQPRFVAAVICGVITYGLMNLLMTSAPLAMRLCGLSLSDSNLAIQWHVVAMYGPSFFTGSIIARLGAPRVIAVGLALTASAAIVGLAGITVANFWVGLILLGVGWNFGFVGASTLVVECHHANERNKVQALNDFLVFGTMAVASFSSGHLLASYGWSMVNLVVFPLILIAAAGLALTSILSRRPAATT